MRIRALFLVAFSASVALADENCPPRYSYCGYSGPAQWANLPIDDNECGGVRQSPINLSGAATNGDAIAVTYISGNATIANTGHDILVTPVGDAGKIVIGGKTYKLRQFHFHVPAEHHVNGVAAPVEMHIVHQLEGGTEYAAVGVMLAPFTNTFGPLMPVFANLPTKACSPAVTVRIDFASLLPKRVTRYYTYAGSLTTPPCTQTVTWYVTETARSLSPVDFRRLKALGDNHRPIQKNPKPLPVKHVVAQ